MNNVGYSWEKIIDLEEGNTINQICSRSTCFRIPFNYWNRFFIHILIVETHIVWWCFQVKSLYHLFWLLSVIIKFFVTFPKLLSCYDPLEIIISIQIILVRDLKCVNEANNPKYKGWLLYHPIIDISLWNTT